MTILRERARREAAQADKELRQGKIRSVLHGIPYGVKDIFATPDAPTTWGAEPYRGQRFTEDAAAVAGLANSGAVLLAKFSMVELGGGFGYGDADASFTGPTRNAWNWKFWSGGSSSGSATAVAAGLVPFALGSETSGSLLLPAAASGITALRPTYGRVQTEGSMTLAWSLDKVGPLARTVRDAQSVFKAICKDQPRPASESAVRTKRRPRIGVIHEPVRACQPDVSRNFVSTLSILESFATCSTT